MTAPARCVILALCTMAALAEPRAQSKEPAPNKELEALQAHFLTTIGRRDDQLFNGISSVADWERERQRLRTALSRMLWNDMPWPEAPPRATVTHRQQYNGYTTENSLPASDPVPERLPAILLVDHRRGIPVWGNEQPLERNQWGQRAVLVVETLDRGSRALEQNLRSFSDDDLVHHMRRQAMVAGTTLESMQVFEILRSLELLRSLPGVDPRAITILGKGTDGVNGMYAALLDNQVQRVIVHSPTPSHVQGPHYLGVLRYTDVSRTAALLEPRLRAYGEVPERFPARTCRALEECLQ